MSERDLVLLGGGHTHALLIRMLAMEPIENVRVTLISEQTLTPYSGMLPGFVAGHYTREQTHVDLNRLCRCANVTWIRARVTGLDAANKMVQLHARHSLRYDKLSIDTGSTPDLSVPGARRYALGVKPVSHFNQTLNKLLERSWDSHGGEWGVVGAGAGGVELVLALAQRLRGCSQRRFHLIYSGMRPLYGYPEKVITVVEQTLGEYGITLHPGFRVTRVTSEGLVSQSGQMLQLDQSIWCTGAAAPQWPADSGIALSDKGFFAVNQFLQSISHEDVFAVGDVADLIHDPRPKAGVYAVRQAPWLECNLRRAFGAKALRSMSLQSEFLSLLSLGEKRAVGCRNELSFSGAWVWRLKDHIDRKFMRRLNQLKIMMSMKPSGLKSSDVMPMQCAGCGSKLGPEMIGRNLARLPLYEQTGVDVALGCAEDATVWAPPIGMQVLQSIDGFRAFSTDLELLGEICVYHALSDLYAMGATPISAQVWINLVHNHPRLQARDHERLMYGIAQALVKERTALAGGHSTEGLETHVGIVANGIAREEEIWRKSTAQVGDMLLLSKPLGSGVVMAADMLGLASADSVDAAFLSMAGSNREVAEILKPLKPAAVTDVTGFGLLGHLREMLSLDNLGASLKVSDVPLLPGALDLAERGIRSSLYPQLQPYSLGVDVSDSVPQPAIDLLLDPQTSGGLLIALSEAHVKDIVARSESVVIIGQVTEPGSGIKLS